MAVRWIFKNGKHALINHFLFRLLWGRSCYYSRCCHAVPGTLSEYAFAGLLRGNKAEVVKSISNDIEVPASAEIILEGYIDPTEPHLKVHTEIIRVITMNKNIFLYFTVTHLTMRKDPIYHSTYTGRPPDEPAVLGEALNEVLFLFCKSSFRKLSISIFLRRCSYRLAVVTIKTICRPLQRVMMGVWSFLRQFMYTKFVIVCDDDINARIGKM